MHIVNILDDFLKLSNIFQNQKNLFLVKNFKGFFTYI